MAGRLELAGNVIKFTPLRERDPRQCVHDICLFLRRDGGHHLIPGAGGHQEPEGQEPEGQEPEDFERLLPRGQIAAISEPTYVPASEANLPPRAWVLGVVIDGQARAYSLDLLNSHEIVNDRIGETNFAAVW